MHVWEENGHILGEKTHKAGKIASIRGKKPHVYRVIILKQMADQMGRGRSRVNVKIELRSMRLLGWGGPLIYVRKIYVCSHVKITR